MPQMTGGRYMAEFFRAYGVRAVFFVPTMLSRPLAEMDDMPIKRVLTHGEKAAAYMADGYARASGRPGVCAAQTVGAANLAAGWAARSTGAPTRRATTTRCSCPSPRRITRWTRWGACRT